MTQPFQATFFFFFGCVFPGSLNDVTRNIKTRGEGAGEKGVSGSLMYAVTSRSITRHASSSFFFFLLQSICDVLLYFPPTEFNQMYCTDVSNMSMHQSKGKKNMSTFFNISFFFFNGVERWLSYHHRTHTETTFFINRLIFYQFFIVIRSMNRFPCQLQAHKVRQKKNKRRSF